MKDKETKESIEESIRELGDICDKRIKVCLNACLGIPDSALESGVVGEMVELVKYIVRNQDVMSATCSMDVDVETIDYAICGAESILSKLEGK